MFNQKGALDGIKVLDLSQFLSGPRAGSILADLGAEVIKIESPMGDSMRLLCTLTKTQRLLSINDRNKKGMVIDFRRDEGKELFLELAKKSDVIIENFIPGTMEKYNLDYSTISKVNPGIIYASISGFGKTGPKSHLPAFDIIAQSSSGIMAAYKRPHSPPGIFFADLVSGSFCAMGIMAAIISRNNTGKGQFIDVSMQDVMYYHHFSAHSDMVLAGNTDETTSLLGRPITSMFTDENNPLPFWNVYPTKDGHIALVALTDKLWNALMDALNLDEIKQDSRFSDFPSRIRNNLAAVQEITNKMKTLSTKQALNLMEEYKIPASMVADKEDVIKDDHLMQRNMFLKIPYGKDGEITIPGFPIKLSATPASCHTKNPELGQHTKEILTSWLSYDDDKIKQLKKSKACF